MIQSGQDLTRFNEGLTLIAKPDNGHFALGYGCDYWNGLPVREGQTCTPAEADAQFRLAYAAACTHAETDIGPAEYAALSEQRQAVLNDMAYQLGERGLAAFHDLLAYVRSCNWIKAAVALYQSRLFSQTTERQLRNIAILITGEWPQ